MFLSHYLGKKRIKKNPLGLLDVSQDKYETLCNYISRFSDRLIQLTNISDKVTTYEASAKVNSSIPLGWDTAWIVRVSQIVHQFGRQPPPHKGR